MHERRLKAALRRTLDVTATTPATPGHRERLEAKVLDAYRDRYPHYRRWLMLLNPWNRAARLAMAGLAVALLGLGACSTSTTTEVEVGQKLTIALSAKADFDMPALEVDLNRFFEAWPGVDGVNFNLRGVDGQTVYEVRAWGRDMDADGLEAALRRQVPELAGATVSVEPISGSVRENLLSHFGHEYLGLELEVDGQTADEIRQRILAQMAESGMNGDAHVEVEATPEGLRTIKVEVSGETTP